MMKWLKRLFKKSSQKESKTVNYRLIEIDEINIDNNRVYIYFHDQQRYLTYLNELQYHGDIFKDPEGTHYVLVEGYALIHYEQENNTYEERVDGFL